MPYYRIYHLDAGRFVGSQEFHADNDVQATRDARSFNRTATLELWEKRPQNRHAPPRETPGTRARRRAAGCGRALTELPGQLAAGGRPLGEAKPAGLG
jgi:hypothetical protein